MGKLAQQNGQSPDVKKYGQMLTDDHSAANQKAMDAAKSLGMTPPNGPSAKQKAEYDKKLAVTHLHSSNGDSVFASSNRHAKRWRQMVYEKRYNEIIDRMIAEERREAAAMQNAVFPTVALFVSTLLVVIFRPDFHLQIGMPPKQLRAQFLEAFLPSRHQHQGCGASAQLPGKFAADAGGSAGHERMTTFESHHERPLFAFGAATSIFKRSDANFMSTHFSKEACAVRESDCVLRSNSSMWTAVSLEAQQRSFG